MFVILVCSTCTAVRMLPVCVWCRKCTTGGRVRIKKMTSRHGTWGPVGAVKDDEHEPHLRGHLGCERPSATLSLSLTINPKVQTSLSNPITRMWAPQQPHRPICYAPPFSAITAQNGAGGTPKRRNPTSTRRPGPHQPPATASLPSPPFHPGAVPPSVPLSRGPFDCLGPRAQHRLFGCWLRRKRSGLEEAFFFSGPRREAAKRASGSSTKASFSRSGGVGERTLAATACISEFTDVRATNHGSPLVRTTPCSKNLLPRMLSMDQAYIQRTPCRLARLHRPPGTKRYNRATRIESLFFLCSL